MDIIVSFSSRTGGNCDQISACIRQGLGKQLKIYRFSDFSIHPCGNCQYQCLLDNMCCPHIQDREYELLDAICHSECTYFVLPNYCDFPNANFFIFNERSQCYFQNHPERLEQYLEVPKKFIVVSGTESDHFRSVLQQHCADNPDLLFISAKDFGKRSTHTDLMESDDARAKILAFIGQPL